MIYYFTLSFGRTAIQFYTFFLRSSTLILENVSHLLVFSMSNLTTPKQGNEIQWEKNMENQFLRKSTRGTRLCRKVSLFFCLNILLLPCWKISCYFQFNLFPIPQLVIKLIEIVQQPQIYCLDISLLQHEDCTRIIEEAFLAI